jgi:hypothetical protein
MCIQLNMKVKVKVKQSLYKPGQALWVAESWGSQISRQSTHEGGKFIRHMHCLPLPPRKYSWYSFLLKGWIDPKAIVWPEWLCQWKIPLTPSGIEAVTFRLAVQCLNQLCHCMPLIYMKYEVIIQSYQHNNKRTINHSVQYIIQYLQWLDNTLMCVKNSSID